MRTGTGKFYVIKPVNTITVFTGFILYDGIMGLKEEFSPENTVAFEQVAPKSNKKFKWICSQGHHWEAVMSNRTKGIGCPYCSGKRILTGYNDLFTVRPDLRSEWSESNTVDPSIIGVGSGERVRWVCPQGHEFESIVSNRTKGHECPYCKGKIPILGINDMTTLFPEIAAQYDHEKNTKPLNLVTCGSTSKYWWTCDKGHSWEAQASNRTRRGDGCPYCSGRYAIAGSSDIATTHSHLVPQWHSDNTKTPQQVSMGSEYRAKWICPINPQHTWEAVVSSRVHGTGCPKCWNGVSSQEKEILEFIQDALPDVEIRTSVRDVIAPKELDIYIPSLKVAIEVNGIFWHTEEWGKDKNYHKNKLLACEAVGVRLITIWQDDWRDKPVVVKEMLLHKLGLSQQEKIMARKTHVVTVNVNDAKTFLDRYHIQGFASGSYYLGLHDKEERLVAVMVLRRLNDDLYLDRYATSCQVVGGQGKLLAWVHRELEFNQLITFADLEVSDGSLYEKTGWIKDKVLDPDYKYVVKGKRVHKFNYRLKRFKDDPELEWVDGLSERELAVLNHIPRVWDSGKIRYIMPRSQ